MVGLVCRSHRRTAALVCAAVLALAGCGGSGNSARSSGTSGRDADRFDAARRGFVGINASEVLPRTLAQQRRVLHQQAAAGISTFRQTFRWDEIEPSKGSYRWTMHDGLVQAAAENGIRVLPIVFATPKREAAARRRGVTVTATTTMPPRDPRSFARFAAVLARRYGANGSFWRAHPELEALPIRSWQVWNEPNLKAYWGGRPNERAYLALVRATGAALRAVDPGVEIVTGGIPNSRLGIPLADYVHGLARAGGKGTFDTLAVHPYARRPDGAIAALVDAREQLDAAGLNHVGLWVTEIGWATGSQHSAFTVGPKTQAAYIAEFLRRAGALAPQLKLRGVAYYAWRDVEPYIGGEDFWGLHTGLRDAADAPKLSMSAFTAAATALRSP